MPPADHEGTPARASLCAALCGLQERGPVAALRSADTVTSKGRRRLLSTVLSAAAVLAADQITKSIALAHLHGPVHMIGPLGFTIAFNSGTAFSLFTGATAALVVVGVIVSVLIGVVAWRSERAGLSVALGLVLGGALGNLSDRLFRGHHGEVVDFVTLSHWPTFNVADAAITIGAVLVIVLSVIGPRSQTR